jgi:hypothetical protein
VDSLDLIDDATARHEEFPELDPAVILEMARQVAEHSPAHLAR